MFSWHFWGVFELTIMIDFNDLYIKDSGLLYQYLRNFGSNILRV